MLTVALFIIARAEKQPKCSSTEERIKMWYIYMISYYSVIKRNEIVPLTEMWIDLETVTQGEISQRKTNINII